MISQDPVFLHANAWSVTVRDPKIANIFLNKELYEEPDQSDLTDEAALIGVCAYPTETEMEKYCKRAKVNFYPLEKGFTGKYDHRLKITAVYNWLKDYRNQYKYLIFTDTNDVLIAGKLQKCIDNLRHSNNKMIWSGEINSFAPLRVLYGEEGEHFNFEHTVKPQTSQLIHVNSGNFVAYTDFALEFYERAVEYLEDPNYIRIYEELKNHWCDQSLVRLLYKEFYPQMTVDYKAELFLCLYLAGGYIG
jgi:hypothetical protein